MPIEKLRVSNFKGIDEPQEFDIRPITIFLGANSSGKSSAIHALMSLVQTLKLGNTTPSLVLDDSFAHVHLGRFSEISHSRNYKRSIDVGIDVGHLSIPITKDVTIEGDCSADYSFKSTLRTQEVYVSSAEVMVGDTTIAIKRASRAPYEFTATEDGKEKFPVARTNFLFRIAGGSVKNIDVEHWLRMFLFLENGQKRIEKVLRETLYLGPFRQSPLRRYPFRGMSANEVGAQGEDTITMLAGEHVQAQDRPRTKQVNQWLVDLNLAKAVTVARVGASDLFDVNMTLPDGNKLPIADLGYGLSQILPVLTQCSFAPNGATLLFEQPELHLHENASKKLAKVFCDTAMKKDAHLIIETHSKELIYELFELIKTEAFSLNNFALYMVKRDGGASKYTRVGIEQDGAHLEISDPWVRSVTHS